MVCDAADAADAADASPQPVASPVVAASPAVVVGPTVLLESGRLARRVGTNRSGRDVFVDVGGHAVCEHGERAATIEAWMKREKADAAFVRPSACTCGNVDGLRTKYDVAAADLPAQPTSAALFALLGELGCEEALGAQARPQRLAYRSKARGGEVWVQPSGALVCPHGNSRRVLATIRKRDKAHRSHSVVQCDCKLAMPDREGSLLCCKPARAT